MKFLVCRKRVLEEWFWIIKGAEHVMVLTAVYEGVNTVLARVRIFISIILYLEYLLYMAFSIEENLNYQ